jgi:hypothetical protein
MRLRSKKSPGKHGNRDVFAAVKASLTSWWYLSFVVSIVDNLVASR